MSRPSVVLFAHKVLAAYVTAGVQTYMGPPGVDLEQKRRIMCLCISPNVCISGVTPTRLCHWVRTIGSHRYVYMVNGAGVLVMSAPRSAHAWGTHGDKTVRLLRWIGGRLLGRSPSESTGVAPRVGLACRCSVRRRQREWH